ncbi:MAG TPA: hypothetical protein VEO55_01440, partial [Candidatus Dormibacteraeota bacterium]|nr:hypothetical protein [Candidatus Dormibacteraeota bacterium]
EYQAQYAQCMNDWVGQRDRLSHAQADLAGCGDEATIVQRYYRATKSAAKSGDVDAQLCYLQAQFVNEQEMAPFTEHDAEDYKADSPKYVNKAIKRGDWRVVRLLAIRQLNPGVGMLRLLDHIAEPETVDRMVKLLILGSSGVYNNELKAELETMVERPGVLSQEQTAAADQWARRTYDEYFSGTPGLTAPPEICAAQTY